MHRSVVIAADRSRVHALVNTFHEWPKWSPWEDLDPELQRTYSGPESGVGARYEWSGNRKAGAGSMEIVSSTPTGIGIELSFLKPWSATNQVLFTLTPGVGVTDVNWAMSGEQTGLMAIIGRLIPMDRMVGKDFEKGLARLKAVAEA